MTIRKHISLNKAQKEDYSILPNFGGTSPDGETLAVSNRYYIKNGKPWYPVMGEFHYSRYPNAYWEEAICKMKAGGIEILATYIFWIHHEEMEGQFIWKDNFDLGRFVSLCKKHGMKVLLRIGPWAHGECRNGGFPDWLLRKEFELRTNDENYLCYVRTFYSQIFQQVKGMLFKDGGHVIGIQLENEYGHCGGLHGEAGKEHMCRLKAMAKEIGFDVPYYTATGWGGGIVVDGEMLPVLGAYADAPWAQHIEELPPSKEFVFNAVRMETDIGTDLVEHEVTEFTYRVDAYPYATAELGGGLQVTQHRRPIVTPEDVELMALVKMGSGANLLGYYMYHGGTNPRGKLSTLQESRETGYANDLPVFSYDFQAPVREYGQIAQSYKNLKLLHMFLNDFGSRLAVTSCFIPEDSGKDPEDSGTLRYALRYGDANSFVFINNYQRSRQLSDKKDIEISIRQGSNEFTFEPFSLANGRGMILPYNFDMDGVKLLTSTAQPLCRLVNENEISYIFFSYEDVEAAYILSKEGIVKIEDSSGECTEYSNQYRIIVSDPGIQNVTRVLTTDGKKLNIYTISRKEAENAWKINEGGKERLWITEAALIPGQDTIQLTVRSERTLITVLPDFEKSVQVKDANLVKRGKAGDFTTYELNFMELPVTASFKELMEYEDGRKLYNVQIDYSFNKAMNDCFLKVMFEGDQAKLYIDGEYCADWFYTGMDWEIGLKRFRERLLGKEVLVEIVPLKENAYIYLEKKPVYENGSACKLAAIKAEAEYSCMFHKRS